VFPYHSAGVCLLQCAGLQDRQVVTDQNALLSTLKIVINILLLMHSTLLLSADSQ
jgi:hypothetical protein